MKNYYAVLGVASDADHEVIKAAFRALAKKYHPDTAADPVAVKARFREINEAHSVLSNPEAREEYDRLLSAQRKDSLNRKSGDRSSDDSAEAKKQHGSSVVGKVRYGAAAVFVFGLVPVVLVLIALIVGGIIVEVALRR